LEKVGETASKALTAKYETVVAAAAAFASKGTAKGIGTKETTGKSKRGRC
jgi:hypothetical protein